MSFEAEPKRIVVQREPRERQERVDWDILILPGLLIGGLGLAAYYKEDVTNFLKDLGTKLKSKELQELIDKILGNIKDAPPIPIPPIGGGGIPTGSTLWTSSAWSNGKSRSISGHHQKDPYDNRLDIAAGSGRKGTFPGDGTAKLQGDQARFYIYANNYNSGMWMQARAASGLDNLSLKLRSRHGEGGNGSNRFGGYGMAFHPSTGEVDSKREDYHNVHTPLGDCSGPKWNDGRFHLIGFTCQDSGRQVVLKGYIDNRHICTVIDRNPKSYMLDKSLYNRRSYSWIRTNGGGSVTLKDASVKEIGALSSANIAITYQLPTTLPSAQLYQYYQYYYPYMRRNRRVPMEMRLTIA